MAPTLGLMGGVVSGELKSQPADFFLAGEERHAKRCICCQGDLLLQFSAVLMPFVAKRIFNHEPIEISSEWGLRDIKSGMAYSLCSTLECKDCGVIFLDYRFSDFELSLLYKDYRDEEYNALRIKYEPAYVATASHYLQRANYLEVVEQILVPYVPAIPDVLDWGGDSGVNSPFRFTANKLHVYDVSTVDTCSEATKISLENCTEQRYDLVACMQVLEHVPFPINVLRQIIKVMQSDTILYLEVPLEGIFQSNDSLTPRGLLKKHWHEHINFFSPESLVALTKTCGLKVLHFKTQSIVLGDRVGAIQMLICKLS